MGADVAVSEGDPRVVRGVGHGPEDPAEAHARRASHMPRAVTLADHVSPVADSIQNVGVDMVVRITCIPQTFTLH